MALAVVLLGSLVLAVVGSACGSSSGSSAAAPTESAVPDIAGQQPTPVKKVGDLQVTDYATDPAGRPFAFEAQPGKLLLVYFGYLSCPDVCPLTMADTASGLSQLAPEEAARVEVAFQTVDLPRDEGPEIAAYLQHFFPDGGFHALRAADDGGTNKVTYRFGAKWQADAHEPGQYYAVAHTGDTYVVDDRGHLVWKWPYGTTGDQIAPALRSLLATTYPAA